jgi:hypothetical protein
MSIQNQGKMVGRVVWSGGALSHYHHGLLEGGWGGDFLCRGGYLQQLPKPTDVDELEERRPLGRVTTGRRPSPFLDGGDRFLPSPARSPSNKGRAVK